jgi:hypothetical protein
VRLRHLVSALLLVLSTATCDLGDSVDPGSIDVFVAVDDANLSVGEESVNFTVTARNVGFDPVTLTGPSDCLLYVEIFNGQGTMVWSSVQASCLGATVTEEIVAGQAKSQTFAWSGVNVAGAYLAPGLYLVRGVARTPGTSTIGPPLTVALD